MGHDWLVVHGSDSLLAVEVTYGNLLNAVYRKSSIPKVYRGTYRQQEDLYSFTEDVTRAYKSPVRAAVPIRRGTEEEAEAYLAVFDQSNGWVLIARAEATTNLTSTKV